MVKNDVAETPIEETVEPKSLRASKRGGSRTEDVGSKVKNLEATVAVIQKRISDIEFDIEELYKLVEEANGGPSDAITLTDLRRFLGAVEKKKQIASEKQD